jgi:prepilin-type N-terminal cleavage/methylation domain-containing protein
MSRRKQIARHGGFTLVELVMVVTIIGMVSAIAVPRISNAANSAATSALEATIVNVRDAIDCYYAEHDRFPGYDPTSGSPDNDQFVNQLTMYSDHNGNTKPTRGYPYIYGPYLRAPFPMSPESKSRTVFVKKNVEDADPPADRFGWIAVLADGDFDVTNDPGLEIIQIDDGDIGRAGNGSGHSMQVQTP